MPDAPRSHDSSTTTLTPPEPAETPETPETPTSAPVAPARPVTTEHHGRARTDDYDWLRDKDSPEVLAHLEAENAWTRSRTEHLADLRETLFTEIKSRVKETDLSIPTRVRDHWYYGRSFEGREYGASCRVPTRGPDDWTPPRPDEDASPDRPALPGEEVLLDLDAMAEGHDFFSLGGSAVSLDGRLLAYAVDTTGDERYTVRVKDLDTGDLRDDQIAGVLGGVTWHPAGEHFYYTTVDETWRPDKVWRHRLGEAQEADELVFHEQDGRFWAGLGRTRSDRFLMIVSGSKTTSEYRVLDTADAASEAAGWWVFTPRRADLDHHLEHAVLGGREVFLVHHNGTGPDYEIAVAPLAPTAPEEWQPLIAHDPACRLEDVDAFAGHLVVHQRSAGLTQLRIVELDPATADGLGEDYLVEFDADVYTIGSGSNPLFDQPTVRLGYTTMAVPSSIYDYDVRTRELTLLKRAEVLGGHDPDDYEEHRLWATAEDGEQVPVSLVCRRGTPRPMPLHLYGYGAYESSMDPYFSSARLSELDRGVAFAIAHVRGGGELGRRWYDDGKLAHKQHTFSDFVACARHLVEQGWTTPDRIVAEGGSAGGLLMGAVANQAPEAVAGILTQVPFVDALTSMLDATLPLTVTEYDEWGNPEDDPAAYDAIAAYAPYDNVTAQRYPRILAETSLHDTRVSYVEPAKWVARLREVALEPDVLLKTEMSAGHGGVSGRYQAWRDRAFELAWLLDVLDARDLPRP